MVQNFTLGQAGRTRPVARLLLSALLALLAACGGGGGDPGSPPFGGGGGTVKAADLSLTLNKASIKNSGSDTVIATVTAVDENRNTVSSIPVTLRVDQSATIQTSGTSTSNAGTVTGTLGIGADRTNRVITVTATSGELVRKATVQVVGTKITATLLPAVLGPSEAGKVSYRVLDDNSSPMAGVEIVVTGPAGVQTTGATGANGDFDYSYTAPAAAGTLDIRASAGGDDDVQSVIVQAGPGAIPPVTTLVRSSSVSANPSVVPVNLPDSNINRSEIRALFVGDANTPVKNVRVRFDLDGLDPALWGSFTAGTSLVYSNANGVAASSYVPLTKFSPTDGVTIRACWDYNDFAAGSCPNAVRTTLTVIADALSVSIGTDKTLSDGAAGLTYIQRFTVSVADSSGLAKSDVLISPSIDLLRYRKGSWAFNVDKVWVRIERAVCDNEDLNRNGVAEIYSNGAVEDANASLNLTPGRPALEPRKADVVISFEGSNRTDTSGRVVVKIEYAKNLGSWVDFNIVVAASGVAGTEGRANYEGVLAVPAAVLKLESDPPFSISPYGVEASPVIFVQPPAPVRSGLLCTNPR